MTVKIDAWVCRYCCQVHIKEDDAKNCEKEHTDLDSLIVVDTRYDKDQSQKRFPKFLLVEDRHYSGTAAMYLLSGERSIEDFYEPDKEFYRPETVEVEN